jgi:protein-disulfide isomerase
MTARSPFKHLAAIAGLGLALALAGTGATRAAEIAPDQRAAFEAIVRDYILKNPEILQEALAELEKRQQDAQRVVQKQMVTSEKTALLNSPHHSVVGNPAGDVTLVEFFDYNCSYCKRSLGDVVELAKSDPRLRIVLKDFPVLGPDSVEASQVALAVRQQLKGDKYLEFHTKLMASKGRVGKERAIAVAKELGVDTTKLAKDMEAPEVKAAIDDTVRLGDRLGLTGTPSFVIGEEVISGAVGIEPLKGVVASVRQCGKATC